MPFQSIGPTELIVILVIVVLLFGVGRIGKVGRELGGAISEFRKGLSGDGADAVSENDTTLKS